MNMLPILMMLNTTTHLLHQQFMNFEEERGDTIDATECTTSEAYIPKHDKNEDLEKEQVSM